MDLVYLSGGTSHVDARWDFPDLARFLERLASFARLITFDRRGSGASDPIPLDAIPTWEEWADDLGAVLDAAGSHRAALFAILDGGPMAMAFAATQPQRTSGLVLGNTTAKLLASPEYPEGISPQTYDLLLAAMDRWGTEEGAALWSPVLSNDPVGRASFAKYMRASATPRVAKAQVQAQAVLDVRHVLPTICVPTLVLHRTDFALLDLGCGRYVAEHIPGARFVEVPGSDSSFSVETTGLVLDTVEEFLTGMPPYREPDRVLATVLFTDFVESTRLATEIGDRRWHELLDRHDAMARAEIQRDRGRMLKTTGDGVLATFDSPGRAIRCTVRLRKAPRSSACPCVPGCTPARSS
jgi:pimeloyl-ACP methyl ester carboxylesterase